MIGASRSNRKSTRQNKGNPRRTKRGMERSGTEGRKQIGSERPLKKYDVKQDRVVTVLSKVLTL